MHLIYNEKFFSNNKNNKLILGKLEWSTQTYNPKYTHYMSDGKGRDTYILKNNGGLWTEAERPIAQSRYYAKEKVRVVIPAPHKDAVSFKYISDGSGRDFYVTYNSGGLQAPYVPGSIKADATFFTSLRKTERRNKVIRYASPKERDRLRKSLASQRQLIDRLTSNSTDWRKINKEFRNSISKDKSNKLNISGDNIYDYGEILHYIFKYFDI